MVTSTLNITMHGPRLNSKRSTLHAKLREFLHPSRYRQDLVKIRTNRGFHLVCEGLAVPWPALGHAGSALDQSSLPGCLPERGGPLITALLDHLERERGSRAGPSRTGSPPAHGSPCPKRPSAWRSSYPTGREESKFRGSSQKRVDQGPEPAGVEETSSDIVGQVSEPSSGSA